MPKTAPRFNLRGRRVEWRATTGSTMLVAAELARAGCASGTVVVADEQTAGVGRHGRIWHSEPGAGLYVSIVLRLDLPAEKLPVTMLALGLATREAIQQTSTLQPDLRWPNDVLLDGKKCAGILAQLDGSALIAGIGINVSQKSFPEGLETPATSLALEGATVSREDLLAALAHAVDRYSTMLSKEGPVVIARLFTEASSYANGRRVRAEAEGRRVEGVTSGLDPSGFLLIREDDGKIATVLAGGVRPA